MITFTFHPDHGPDETFEALTEAEAQHVAAQRFHNRPGYLTRPALDEAEWCDEAGCPASECVACKT